MVGVLCAVLRAALNERTTTTTVSGDDITYDELSRVKEVARNKEERVCVLERTKRERVL